MIIVEGIDRVGKTTIAKMISKKLGIKIFDNPYMDFTWIDSNNETKVATKKASYKNMFVNLERMNVMLNFLEQFKTEDYIADRFHMTEYVYGKNDRGYKNLSAFNQIDERLANLGAIIVYVKPKDINWSSEQHGSDLSSHLKDFNELIGITKCKVITCDCDSLEEAVCELAKMLEVYK